LLFICQLDNPQVKSIMENRRKSNKRTFLYQKVKEEDSNNNKIVWCQVKVRVQRIQKRKYRYNLYVDTEISTYGYLTLTLPPFDRLKKGVREPMLEKLQSSTINRYTNIVFDPDSIKDQHARVLLWDGNDLTPMWRFLSKEKILRSVLSRLQKGEKEEVTDQLKNVCKSFERFYEVQDLNLVIHLLDDKCCNCNYVVEAAALLLEQFYNGWFKL